MNFSNIKLGERSQLQKKKKKTQKTTVRLFTWYIQKQQIYTQKVD